MLLCLRFRDTSDTMLTQEILTSHLNVMVPWQVSFNGTHKASRILFNLCRPSFFQMQHGQSHDVDGNVGVNMNRPNMACTLIFPDNFSGEMDFSERSVSMVNGWSDDDKKYKWLNVHVVEYGVDNHVTNLILTHNIQ